MMALTVNMLAVCCTGTVFPTGADYNVVHWLPWTHLFVIFCLPRWERSPWRWWSCRVPQLCGRPLVGSGEYQLPQCCISHCLDATVCCVSPFLAHAVKCIEVLCDFDSMLCCERLYMCCVFHTGRLLPCHLFRTVWISASTLAVCLCIIFGFWVVCVAWFNHFFNVQCSAVHCCHWYQWYFSLYHRYQWIDVKQLQ